MGKKKQARLQVDRLEPLRQNPFSQLGSRFGIEPGPRSQAQDAKEEHEEDAMLFVRLERRKHGKAVTCIYHLAREPKEVLGALKRKLATGGSYRDGVIELQGDHRNTAAEWLRDRGFKLRMG